MSSAQVSSDRFLAQARERPACWRWGEPTEILERRLRRGGLLAIPTESSYGLAVDPRNESAVEAVYDLKRRERGKPLPVVIADVEQLAALAVSADLPQIQRIRQFWPAALSVLVPLRERLPATGDDTMLAVRVPAHPELRELLANIGPLTATSANLAGEPAILDPASCLALLAGRDAAVIDDGRLPGGPPSTLIAWRGEAFEVLRHGRFPADRLSIAGFVEHKKGSDV